MLATHYILHASFLSAFFVTATPIPTSLPHLVPNHPSDSCLRDTPGSTILPSAIQIREDTTTPNIGIIVSSCPSHEHSEFGRTSSL
ncbi:hypothetical protein H0H93_014251, partial [Arthromyces matolae]